MGFAFKSLKTFFGSGTKLPKLKDDKPEPLHCPIPKGTRAVQALLNGEDSALDLLIATQQVEASRASSTSSLVAERKPYSIQPCAYPETRKWIDDHHDYDTLGQIVALRDSAAEFRSSADLVKFGHNTIVDPAALKLPKFDRRKDGFIPLSKMFWHLPSNTQSDEQSEVASITNTSQCGTTLVEGQWKEPPIQPGFEPPPEPRRGTVSGPSDPSGDPDYAAYDSDSDTGEYEEYFGFGNDGTAVDSDTYSLNPEVLDATAVKAAKAHRVLIAARAELLRKVSGSNLTQLTEEVSDDDDDIVEIDTNDGAADIKPRHVIRPPAPPEAPLIPLSRLHKGEYHYTSEKGQKCLAFVKSYLDLPADMPVGKLLYHIVVSHPEAAKVAALANPALVRAMDDLDFTGLLGSPDLPRPPPGIKPKDMSAEGKTAYWDYSLIKAWSEYMGRQPEIFTHLTNQQREQIRLINEDTYANEGFEWENEGTVSRGEPGSVRLWTMEKRMTSSRGKTVREWNSEFCRKRTWVPATPSYLSIVANADEGEAVEEDGDGAPAPIPDAPVEEVDDEAEDGAEDDAEDGEAVDRDQLDASTDWIQMSIRPVDEDVPEETDDETEEVVYEAIPDETVEEGQGSNS